MITQGWLARVIARTAHAGQLDKDATEPHYAHVERVAEAVIEGYQPVAYLHDVLEDTAVTISDLLDAGVLPGIVADVIALTKKEGEDYTDYIERVAGAGGRVRAVKLADLNDNIQRAEASGRQGLVARYARALDRLEGGG